MNLYNKQTQILEIKDTPIEESKNQDWTTYTYRSSNPNKTAYTKVIVQVNFKKEKSQLELLPQNNSKLMNGLNTVVQFRDSSCSTNKYKESSITDRGLTLKEGTKIFSQPNSNLDPVFTVSNSSRNPFTVKPKDKVCSFGEQSLWYEVFYKINESTTKIGWFKEP